jgi:hypothetical protein
MKKIAYGVAVIAVIVVVGMLVRLITLRTKSSVVSETVVENSSAQVTVPTAQSSSISVNKFDERVAAVYAKDADFDGILDVDEKKYGTRPDNPDSDGDGILDGDEIKLYTTNPTKADTDGDGVKDGVEILRGRNPLVKEVVTPTVSPSSTKR